MNPATLTPAPTTARSSGQGGHRLAAAFDSVSRLPASEESVARVTKLAGVDSVAAGDVADAIEADPAVTIAVLRAANELPEMRGRVGSVLQAVELLTAAGVADLVAQLDTYGPFRHAPGWDGTAERFRRHAVSTRYAVEQIADLGVVSDRDLVVSAALLHDLGQLVIMCLYPNYAELVADRSIPPEERALRERRELGIDHCVVGGVLARRWGLPGALADAVSGHHSESAEGLAAAIRLGDLVVHHVGGNVVLPEAVDKMAATCGLSGDLLGRLLYDSPHSGAPRPRRAEPSPLSRREVDALRGLGDGKVYREIAEEMGLSPSTVRTHLHNVYRKIGAADRAQAVLMAREKGWI